MRLGVCSGIENIGLIEEAGYDYIEPAVVTIAGLSEHEFEKAKKITGNSSIKAEVCNIFVSSDMKLVGSKVDHDKIKGYLLRAVDRVSRLGTEVIVFGSGGARKVPEDFSKQIAWEQLVEFLNMASRIVEPYGITIVIEPLPLRSCNIINNVQEGLELSKTVNLPNVRLLADYYHMLYHNENIESITEAGTEYIRHIHVNNPDGGLFPKITDKIDYSALFEPLRKIGYKGRISIEASTGDIKKDLVESMKLWKTIFTDAKGLI